MRTKRRLKKEEMEDRKGHTCSTGWSK
jgi:hypothetical protein